MSVTNVYYPDASVSVSLDGRGDDDNDVVEFLHVFSGWSFLLNYRNSVVFVVVRWPWQ